MLKCSADKAAGWGHEIAATCSRATIQARRDLLGAEWRRLMQENEYTARVRADDFHIINRRAKRGHRMTNRSLRSSNHSLWATVKQEAVCKTAG